MTLRESLNEWAPQATLRLAAADKWTQKAALRLATTLGARLGIRSMKARGALALLSVVAVAALSSEVWARPGGGESFGGGGRRGGGGGGGGGGGDIGLVIQLLYLCIRFPALGAVVLVVVIGYYVINRAGGAGLSDWSAGVPTREVTVSRPHYVARGAIDKIRQWDPYFSVVLFEDFIYTLYAQIHLARPKTGLAKLGPYLDDNVQKALTDDSLEGVSRVLIGSLRFVGLQPGQQHTRVTVEVESNLTETRGGNSQRLYLVERVTLIRPRNARSRGPERSRTLDCPNCGAPLEAIVGNQCSYCKEHVTDGRFDWKVYAIECVRLEKRPPLLTTEVAERGTELSTVVQPRVQERLGELCARDEHFAYERFLERVKVVFTQLQIGWTTMNLSQIRPHVSDNLFQYFGYWLDLYGQAGARNVTENARILDIHLSSVISDATYDAITVRVFATGLDYTMREDGTLIKGSKSVERRYTEYWTLIRGRAAKSRDRDPLACANCGAPLNVSMAGTCEYCHVKVVTGDFDWVLSRIEQDDNYSG